MKPKLGKETLRWFDEFAYQEYPHVKALAAKMLHTASRPASDAEDIAQEFFVVAYRHAEKVRTHPKQKAWVYKAVYLTFLNYQRREERQNLGRLLENFEDIADGAMFDEALIFREMLYQVLDELPARDYKLYQDVYRSDLSPAQIAAKEGVRPGTIYRRISRLNQKLRKKMKKLSENDVIRHNISERSSRL